jgi:AraC-like DNA-binding protein
MARNQRGAPPTVNRQRPRLDGKIKRNETVDEMHRHYLQGATLEEVGQRAGISRERVRQLFNDAELPTRTRAVAWRRKMEARAQRANAGDELIAQQFREGKNIQTLADEHDLAVSAIRTILRAKLSRREYLDVPTDPQPKRYTDEDLIEFLGKAARGHNGPLSVVRYNEVADRSLKRWPSVETYRIRFGSWTGAVQAAGLPASNPSPWTGERISREECLAAVRAVTQALGELPTRAEYDRRARESNGSLPSLATVAHRCGGWRQALRSADV